MRGMNYKNIRPIEILHHEWCKKEGRDTSWYKDWRKTYVETPKLLRKNKKRKSLDK